MIPIRSEQAIQNMPTEVLVGHLREWAVTGPPAVRGAVEIMVSYNAGTLIQTPLVRGFISVDSVDGGPYVMWRLLAAELAKQETALNLLGSMGRRALGIACSLAVNARVDLGDALSGFGERNGPAVLRGLAMAMRIPTNPEDLAALAARQRDMAWLPAALADDDPPPPADHDTHTALRPGADHDAPRG